MDFVLFVGFKTKKGPSGECNSCTPLLQLNPPYESCSILLLVLRIIFLVMDTIRLQSDHVSMENFNLSKFNALFLTGGRDQSINIAVTTDDSEAVEAIKDGFLQVFEHVVIQPHSSVSGIAPLPVGFSAGVKGAQHRIANLVRGKKIIEGQVIIGFEEMVCELLPGK